MNTMGVQCPLAMPAHTINPPPWNQSTSSTQLSRKRSPSCFYTWWWPSALYNENLNSLENIMLCHRWRGNKFGLCCVSQFNLNWRRCGVNCIPTCGQQGLNPNSRRRFLTVIGLIRLLWVPGITKAISMAVQNRLQRWVKHMYRSCLRDVTHRVHFFVSFVIPVWRKCWYEQFIVDILIWKFLAMTAYDVQRRSIWIASLRCSCNRRTMFQGTKRPDFRTPSTRQYTTPLWLNYCVH